MPPPISRPTSDRHAELIARALAHAESHLDEPLTAETLADCAAMSRHHFHRVFRAYVGSTRSITLTSEGTLFLERSRRILAEIEAAELELSQSSEVPRGRLRVSLPLVSSLVLPVLADFMLQYPEIELDLDFSDRMVDVNEEGFDAVVRTSALSDSRLSARLLGSFRLLLAGSPDYFVKRGVPVKPTDLANHICLHYRFPNTGKLQIWPLRREAEEREVNVPISMICNNIETRLCFALRGLGIACLPDFSIRAALADGSLCTVLDEHVEQVIDLSVIWPTSRTLPPRLRVFIDFLAERFLVPARLS